MVTFPSQNAKRIDSGMARSTIHPGRIDFVTLRLFRAVAEAGSITKGAQRCHLALSAASRRLTDFEESAGSPLMERRARGVTLTAAGHVALQHAIRLCEGFDRFGSELAEYAEGVRGHVRLWANMSALTETLPDALSGFMDEFPDIKVEIEEQLSGETVRALVDGLADVGIFAEGTPCDGLQTVPFQQDELVVVAPRGQGVALRGRVHFRDCLALPFVGLNPGTSLLALMSQEAEREGMPLRLRVQVRSFGAMCRMVGANLGLGLLPLSACEPLLQAYGLRVLRLRDPWARRRLLAGRALDRPPTQAAALLWDRLVPS